MSTQGRNHGGRRSGDSESARLKAGERPYHLTAAEEQSATDLLASGSSIASTASALGRANPSISALAQRLGLDPASPRLRRMAAAADYNHIYRLEATNQLILAAMEHLAAGLPVAKDLRDLAVVIGIASDKRRLEEGLSTSNISARVQVWGRRALPGQETEQETESTASHNESQEII